MKAEKIGMIGEIELVHRDNDGKIVDVVRVPNTVVNAGLNECSALLMADVTGTGFDWISIGTGTAAPAAANTILASEITTGGGAKAAGTGTQVTTTVAGDTGQLVATYTFSAAHVITESGVFNATGADTGDLLCRQTFSAINVASGDSLQVTWKVAFS